MYKHRAKTQTQTSLCIHVAWSAHVLHSLTLGIKEPCRLNTKDLEQSPIQSAQIFRVRG